MKKRIHNVDILPKFGPYSHVVEADGFLFVSGIVSIDIKKDLTITDDIRVATGLVLTNVKER